MKLPNKLFGIEAEEAYKRCLKEPKKPQVPIQAPVNINNQESYIILPERSHGTYSYPDLLVSMEKIHFDNNWYQAHEELNKENAFMLTIRQYIDFINLLKSGDAFNEKGNKVHKNKLDSILDEILTVRDPWRAEWLDAKFNKISKGLLKGSEWIINYHTINNGSLIPLKLELLEDCLMTDKLPGINLDYWLKNATKQGLPPSNTPTGDLWYWHPIDEAVAGFCAGSIGVSLSCYGNPLSSDASLGVRPARKK